MIFKTESGSVYEVDQLRKLCRRIGGLNPATARQGPDGYWRAYLELGPLEVGRPAVFLWEREGQNDPMLRPGTVTSKIVEIVP